MADEKTVIPDERTIRVPNSVDAPTARQTADNYAEKTVRVGAVRPIESEKTVLLGRGKAEEIADPVTGWLVVIQGPGRGQSLKLGLGLNGVGRAPGQRISLNFGDEGISRENHAVVTYDPRGRKFYLQHGGGSNLTYIGDEPVLQPRELKSGEDISLGSTVIRFVAFCGPDFGWDVVGAAPSP